MCIRDRSGEKWVAHVQANLREMYFNCLRQAADRLKKRREYSALLKLASSACSLYPYEECWIMKIECLLAMKRYGEATALYNEVTNKYFSEGFEPVSYTHLDLRRPPHTDCKSCKHR